MTTDQLKGVILEAVDCLRQRKCRPDRESIAVFVMRKLGSSMNEIFSEIENIVDQGLLLKVEYKGSTSYRSPKNFDVKNSPLLTKHSKILNSSKTSRYIISGINELLSTSPNYNTEGVPYDELRKKLLEFDNDRFGDSGITVIFEREEAAGNIIKAHSDDPVYPIRIFPKDIKVPSEMKIVSFSEETQEIPESKKRKRVKKETDDVGVVNNSSPPVPAKAKRSDTPKKPKAQQLVYAVKSDPHKIPKKEPQENVQNKADQISSIGFKVITAKGSSSKSTKSAASLNSKTDTDPQFEKTPSLALVSHDTGNSNSASLEEGDTETESESIVAERVPDQASNPVKSGKRKKEAATLQQTKSKPYEQIALYHQPPLYTYGSKKRRLMQSTESSNGSIENFTAIAFADSIATSSPTVEECAYCRKEKNSQGEVEDFLSCGTCNSKIHPTCIDYSEEHAKLLRMNSSSSESQWQCFSCKRCGVCHKALMLSKNGPETIKRKKLTVKGRNKNEQRYILCDKCDKGYHVTCIANRPLPTDASTWYCSECEKITNQNGATPSESKSIPKSSGKFKNARKKGQQSKEEMTASTTSSQSEASLPDISSWTPAQVQKYFIEKGLHDEAKSLRDQEIDGMSLLLLRRADIIFGLNLRLGPALKIYRLVCQLQQNSSALKKKNNASSIQSQMKKIP